MNAMPLRGSSIGSENTAIPVAGTDDLLETVVGEFGPIVLSQTMLAINDGALEYLGPVMAIAGFWGQHDRGCLLCKRHRFLSNSRLLMVAYDGRWEIPGADMAFGWNLISLFMLLFQENQLRAAVRLKRIVNIYLNP